MSRTNLTDSKIACTPLEANMKFTPTDGKPLDDSTLYRQLVGSLIYLTIIQPDIFYAVHIVNQFMSAPRTTHFVVVLHILRYVKSIIFHGLFFLVQSSIELKAYFDTDWVGDPTDRRSTIGYFFFLGDFMIS